MHCDWSEWNVGKCSKSCGGGMLTKTRVADPENDGEHAHKCPGPTTITESCHTEECPGDLFV